MRGTNGRNDLICKAEIETEAMRTPPGKPREYWSGSLFPSPGDLLGSGMEPRSPALQADSLSSEPPGKARYMDAQGEGGGVGSWRPIVYTLYYVWSRYLVRTHLMHGADLDRKETPKGERICA